MCGQTLFIVAILSILIIAVGILLWYFLIPNVHPWSTLRIVSVRISSKGTVFRIEKRMLGGLFWIRAQQPYGNCIQLLEFDWLSDAVTFLTLHKANYRDKKWLGTKDKIEAKKIIQS